MHQLSFGDGSIVVDLFAGGGGASIGIEAALGRPVDVAINHDPIALEVHRANHPATRHLEADVWEVRPRAATGGRPVRLLWASPDCTHFSIAKGDRPRVQSIRTLAWVVTRWAAEVTPDVIVVENVREFEGWGPLGADGRPDKARLGQTFRAWRRRLERLGYVVDHRLLDASAYGAPTRRRRLFIVARRDGLPVAWPEPTHGLGLEPFRTAADCIDWSIPCPSIFERKKPLAEKTLWRIARGIQRFVIEAAEPFLVQVNHGKWEPRASSLASPIPTVTAGRRSLALVAPTLVQTGYGERPGQRPRYLDLHEPLGTCVDGQKHALVSAFLVKHFGDPGRSSGGGVVLGQRLDRPLGTVTARDHHGLAAVTLANLRGDPVTHLGARDVADALPTVIAKGTHVAEVRAFFERHDVGEPRVVVDGERYAIVDVGMRMLQPHELLRAQFGRFAEGYDLSAAPTKAAKVKAIGNSVCPEVAEAIVRANLGTVASAKKRRKG